MPDTQHSRFMRNIPSFSIITTAFNAEAHLERCLHSVINQSFPDWEMICVDDGSTDATSAILTNWTSKDNRIRFITQNTKRGSAYSRKIAILQSRGHYIIILDSDDELAENALATANQLVQKYPDSIIHCATNIVYAGNAPNTHYNFLKKIQPWDGMLSREEFLEHMYLTGDICYNLWGKIYPAAIIKKAAEKIENGYFFRAEDLYFSFIIADLAESYVGIPSALLYNYYIGTGGSFPKSGIFPYLCSCFRRKETILALFRYIDATRNPFLIGLKPAIAQSAPSEFIRTWIEETTPEVCISLLDEALKCYTFPELSALLFAKYAKSPDIPAKILCTAKQLHPVKTPVKNVAIAYHGLANGDIEKKISHLISLLQKQGRQIFLITTLPVSGQDPIASPNIIHVTVPSSLAETSEEREKCSQELYDFLQQNQIDTLIDFRKSDPSLFFDMLIAKALGVRYVIDCCEMFSQGIARESLYNITQKINVFRFADYVIVSSRADEFYWRSLGVNAQMIQYPPLLMPPQRDRVSRELPTVAWTGRFEHLQKRFMDLVPIFKRVLAQIPDAKMLIAGEGNEIDKEKLKIDMDAAGISDHVEFFESTHDVTTIYDRCSVMLCTSLYESFGHAIWESRIRGIPVVSYDMPYLEQFADPNNGIYRVPQLDTKAAANAIVKLLTDHELYLQFSRNAKQDASRYLSTNAATAWEKVFSQLIEEKRNVAHEKDNLTAVVLQTMLFHTARIVEKHQKENTKCKKEIEKYKAENAKRKKEREKHKREIVRYKKAREQLTVLRKLKASRSYQIGRAVTWAPRMVRNAYRCFKQHGFSYTLKRIPVKFVPLYKKLKKPSEKSL